MKGKKKLVKARTWRIRQEGGGGGEKKKKALSTQRRALRQRKCAPSSSSSTLRRVPFEAMTMSLFSKALCLHLFVCLLRLLAWNHNNALASVCIFFFFFAQDSLGRCGGRMGVGWEARLLNCFLSAVTAAEFYSGNYARVKRRQRERFKRRARRKQLH